MKAAHSPSGTGPAGDNLKHQNRVVYDEMTEFRALQLTWDIIWLMPPHSAPHCSRVVKRGGGVSAIPWEMAFPILVCPYGGAEGGFPPF